MSSRTLEEASASVEFLLRELHAGGVIHPGVTYRVDHRTGAEEFRIVTICGLGVATGGTLAEALADYAERQAALAEWEARRSYRPPVQASLFAEEESNAA